jgi:hypothetical protein
LLVKTQPYARVSRTPTAHSKPFLLLTVSKSTKPPE